MGPRKEHPFSKYFYPAGFAVVGAGTAAVKNFYLRRPHFSGLHRHAIYGAIGWIIGMYVDRYYEKKWSERDAVVRHYIELHPEDFQEKKRKYKEVFDVWYPMR